MSEFRNRLVGHSQDRLPDCLVCDSPIQSADDGIYVCDECEGPTPTDPTRSTPCREVTVEHRGVTLQKRLLTETESPRVEYGISSTRSDRIKFRILDHLPAESEQSTASPVDGNGYGRGMVDVTWWLGAESEITVRRDYPSRDELDQDDGELTIEAVPRLQIDAPESGVESVGVSGEEGETGHGENTDLGVSAEESLVLAALPAYNEARTIEDVVSTANRHADAVLVVDDGSDDETASRAWAAGGFVVQHETNRGYGAALQTIFDHAAAIDVDHLAILDGDGQHDPADIPRLVDEQRATGAELVIGNRFADDAETEVPLYRRFGLSVINGLTNLSLGLVRSEARIRDTQSGFRVYDSRAIESLRESPEVGDRMGVSTDILYHAHLQDFDIAEVGTTISYHDDLSSSHHPLAHGYMLVRNVWRIAKWERPLLIFGAPGTLLAFGGLAVVVLLMSQFSRSGTFPGAELFAALAAVLLGTFAFLTGIVLHSLRLFQDHTA